MYEDRLGDILKRWLGYAFLSIGGFWLFAMLLMPFDKQSDVDNRSATLGCLVLGVPFTLVGSLMVSSSYDAKRRHQSMTSVAQQQSLRRVLYLLIEANDGGFTPMQYAIAADISVKEAETFLNNQSKLLNADFDVTSQGTLVYLFPGSR